MRLRTEEDSTPRLSPAEARAFLEVHAEREAEGSIGSAPSIEDLAETLRISPDEARSILQEARTRLETPSVIVPSRAARLAPALTMALGLVMSIAIVVGMTSVRRTAPPVSTAPAVSLPWVSPVSTTAVDPHASEISPLDSIGIQIVADGKDVVIAAKPGRLARTLRELDESESRDLRSNLIEKVLQNLATQASIDPMLWSPERLTIGFGQTGGRWTSLVVPIQASSFSSPQNPAGQEQLREILAPLLDAAWPQIVDAAPR